MTGEVKAGLTFFGGAGTVTGSRTLLSAGGARVLVDCGMFQGLKALRLKNWERLPGDLIAADSVLLTHAHLDHSGALPILIRSGFRGKIFATPATRDLCDILLRDSARLQEDDARYANKHATSKHKPALPLFTTDDVERVMTSFETVPFGQRFEVASGMSARFFPAGHILGAASVQVDVQGKTLVFSGDVGRENDVLIPPPERPTRADYVVIESTYGGRRHGRDDAFEVLGEIVRSAVARGAVVVVPAFAVGRAQEILYHLHRLRVAQLIPEVPIFLNSPMASRVLDVFEAHVGGHRLSRTECAAMCNVAEIVDSVEASKALNGRQGPMIIIAGSGMATGGRVIHHLRQFGPDPRNMILLVGFQAMGTRGAQLAAGAAELTIFGERVPIRAEVLQLPQFSAHADEAELLDWLAGLATPPARVFVNHGEPGAADALRHQIERRFGWPCTVPAEGDRAELF